MPVQLTDKAELYPPSKSTINSLYRHENGGMAGMGENCAIRTSNSHVKIAS